MRTLRVCSIAVLSALLCGSSAILLAQQPQQQQKLNSADLERAHMMLRQAYDDVKKNYYDPKYHEVDLDGTYRQLDAALDAVKSNNEAFRVIAGYLLNLHDSHTFFMPPPHVNRSVREFHTEMVGDACFVTRIRPNSDAAAKLLVGDQVLARNGLKIQRADFETLQYFFQIISPSSIQQFIVQGPSGERRQEIIHSAIRQGKATLDLSDAANDNDFWKLVQDDETEAHLDRERTVDAGDTFIWKMPQFNATTNTITTVFSKARQHRTLILDLRGNPGGAVDTLKDMLGNVFDHDIKVGDRVTRKDSKPETAKTFGRSVFTGKLIVLINSESASAAEIFARVIQIEHRGTVLGDRSAGAVMEARHYNESVGVDYKVFYGFSISSANLVMTDGKSLEGTGVTPDEMVLPTATDLAEGKDPVLSRAAELAGTKLDPVAAGKLFPFEWPSL
jgi:C-terminal processing protease CtpA/Prc